MVATQCKVTAVPDQWDTLAKRIAWIQAHRDISPRALALSAGLSKGAVAAALQREKVGGDANFGSANNAKLAKAANVNPQWLATGEGSPTPDYVPPAEPAANDTQQLVNRAAKLLVELDGLPLADALVLLHDVRAASPSVETYYRAARLKLVERTAAALEEQAMREFRSQGAPAVRRAQHKSK